ncbi:MAG: YjhX family toxin [Pseudomonadota bacterium]
MNISKFEQRVLHVLAQGWCIRFERNQGGKITSVWCVTREGALLSDCTLPVFTRLKRRGFIGSSAGGPDRLTRKGRLNVRSQLDNR